MPRLLQKIAIVLISVPAFLCSVVFGEPTDDGPSILNINSYYAGLNWTDEQADAFSASIHDQWPRARIYREYLDSKRKVLTDDYISSFNDYLRAKYDDAHFDLVYVTDDDALQFVQRVKQDLVILQAPIVFSGIDDLSKLPASLLDNATGVEEDLNREKLFNLISRHHPDLDQLVLLTRHADSLGELARQHFQSKPDLTIHAFSEITATELREVFRSASPKTVVLAGILRIKGPDEGYVPWGTQLREASRGASASIYLLDRAPLWSSVVGSNAGVAEEQGSVAGELAIKILSGASPTNVASVQGTPHTWIFNAVALKRFGIDPSQLEAGARIVKPKPLLTPLQYLLVSAGALFVIFETALILYIISHRRRRKAVVRALQESEERLRGYLEHSPLPVAILGKDGGIAYINHRHASTFGYSVAELTNQQHWSLFFPNSHYRDAVREAWRQELEAAKQEKRDPRAQEWKVRAKDGRLLDIQFNYTQIGEHGFAVFFDVTERKRALEALEAATKNAQAANEAKSQFLANMSHEIRTPMNGVLGMAQLLMETNPTAEQRDYIKTIKDSSQLLLTVINDLLDLSKIEAGQMDLDKRPTELRPFVDSCIGLVEKAAREKGLALVCKIDDEVPSGIICDSNRLSQILLNLLSNAIKFTETGKISLEVACKYLSAQQAELSFKVSDTGIGIAPEHLEKIFLPFDQGDPSSTRRFGGTGLGLSISRRLVEMMGGQIAVRSRPDHGSTFSFTIVADLVSGTVQNRLDAGIQSRLADEFPLRILIAEDNPVNQKVARLVLNKMGYTPDIAANGVEALRMVKEGTYDVVLMDIQMPEMDGYTTSRKIRDETPSDQQPWIIALTAHALTEDIEKCKAAGMDDYLSKPLRSAKLAEALQGATSARRIA